VGVAKDSKYHRVTENPQPYFYTPIRQIFRPEYGLTFDVRTSGSVNEAIAALRREATAIDPELTIFDAEPMTEYVAASLFGAKIAASLLSVLSGLGLLLAAIGLYSVMAYAVAQRTGEIGIRVTLGAQPKDIMRLVIRQGPSRQRASLWARWRLRRCPALWPRCWWGWVLLTRWCMPWRLRLRRS